MIMANFKKKGSTILPWVRGQYNFKLLYEISWKHSFDKKYSAKQNLTSVYWRSYYVPAPPKWGECPSTLESDVKGIFEEVKKHAGKLVKRLLLRVNLGKFWSLHRIGLPHFYFIYFFFSYLLCKVLHMSPFFPIEGLPNFNLLLDFRFLSFS